METNKEKFIQLLQIVNREGTDKLIKYLEETGFFEAPASTKFHGAYDGGLCEHCINVFQQASIIYRGNSVLNPAFAHTINEESLIVASLLHDVCKAEIYNKTKKFRKTPDNKWEQYDTYDHDYSKFPMGHGEKSVIVLLKLGYKLTDDEMLAIRWHMGAWDLSDYGEIRSNFNAAADKCPLISIIMAADSLASRIIETRGIK